MSLDLLEADGTTAATYILSRIDGNKATYRGPVHTDLQKDQVVLNSNPPSSSASSYGNRRGGFKYLRSVDVPNPDGTTVVKDAKVEINFSLPVGASAADVDILRARITSITEAQFEGLMVDGITQV